MPVFNLQGVEPGQLRLTGALLADIFLGKIATWNDPAIAAANPGVALPAEKITVVHRSDGSGTTFNFSNYLAKVSPEWQQKVGEGTSLQWPTGVGGKGNEGVAAYVKQIKGGIGYVELAYALQNGMPYASLQNAAGQWVQPSAESFAAAAASADWANARDFNLVITNAPGEKSWPITATNFMLMRKQAKDPARNAATLAFFKWAFEQGQAQADELHYVPLPPERAAAALVALSFAAQAHANDVTGAGASFVYPVMSKWSADYKAATGKQVNYQSIGSGGGIAQIKAGTVDFGSSDAPLPPQELAKYNLAQFPSVIGGVVPIVNVQGVAPGALKLDGHTLAGIFLGRITRWNDPAIAALNRGLALPDTKITVVHRSDGSGTTFNFVNYLSKISPEWKQKVGEGTSVQWPYQLNWVRTAYCPVSSPVASLSPRV